MGYLLAILVGISLGLIGSGGSILAVPILVYILGIDPVQATTMSLFIVGSTAFAGGINNFLSGKIHWKTIVFFGLPSIVSVLLTRWYILPLIPATIFKWNGIVLTKPVLLMCLFAIVMVSASRAMIRPIKRKTKDLLLPGTVNYGLLFLMSVLIGSITGLVGAGGGFLIIPALVFLAKLSMKRAVATSLVIIFINSYIGFFGSLPKHDTIDWPILTFFTFFSIAGVFVGNMLAKRVAGDKLKKGFGWFVLVMGIYILSMEIFHLN